MENISDLASITMPKNKKEQNIVKFLFESGQLKQVKRSGWWMINIKDPENVAEHSFRCAIVGYVLSKMEKCSAEKVVLMCLFQDLPEARITDLHKVAHRYIDVRKAEKEALREQMQLLPKEYGNEITKLFYEFSGDLSKEGIVARDADLLENALSAKEYMDMGHKEAVRWIHNIRKLIKTKSAKTLLKTIEKTNSKEWSFGLKKAER